MLTFLVRRLVGLVLLLVVISIAVFLLFFAAPANPAALTCGKTCSPQVIKLNEEKLGYDKPIAVQYGNFVKGIFVGRTYPANQPADSPVAFHCDAPCLGYSYRQNANVTDLVVNAFPVTFSLAIGAFVMWIVFGVATGIISALKRGTFIDRAVMTFSLAGISLPTFFTALLFLYFISIKFGLVPVPNYVPFTQNPFSWAQNLLLPWLSLAIVFASLYTRLTRANMLETMGEDFIRTARSKGLPERTVIGKHGLRAALTPIVTIAGLDLGTLLGGAVVTESVYNFNGLGRLAIDSVVESDLPVVVGTVCIAALFIIVANLVVDLLYAVVDPRVRVS